MYYSFENMLADTSNIQKRYAGLVECETIGYSVLGKPIIMLHIGCGLVNMFITAGVHGRESVNTGLLMKVMTSYIDTYYDKPEYMKYSFYVVPLLNPDGYIMALTDKQYYEYKYNANCVDINRDFPCKSWSRYGASGNEPASQPETKALIAAFKSHPSVMYVDVHSRGNCIYYYRHSMSEQYNLRQRCMADILSDYTGYSLVNPEYEIDNGDAGGNTVHYYSEHFGMPAFTIETANDTEEFPMNYCLIGEIYDKLQYLPEAMIQCSRYI